MIGGAVAGVAGEWTDLPTTGLEVKVTLYEHNLVVSYRPASPADDHPAPGSFEDKAQRYPGFNLTGEPRRTGGLGPESAL